MGLGILFLGYLIGFNTVAYPGFTKIFSYLVMLLAMVRLEQYNRHLKAAYHVLIPTTAVGAIYLFVEAASVFSLLSAEIELLLFRIVPLAAAAFELVFFFYLLKGLFLLAVETDVKILVVAAFRNRIFTVAYYLLYMVGQLDYSTEATRFLIYYNLAILLVGFVIMLMNAKLIYNFYMWICRPEDIERERKTSSSSALGKLGKKINDAADKQMERRVEQDMAYRAQKQKRKDTKKRR